MNQKNAVLLMSGLVLVGCSTLPPQTDLNADSTVDPIAHAQFLYKNYSQTTNLWLDPFGLGTDGLVVKNYSSHREYSKSFAVRNKLASLGKDDPYDLGNNPNFDEKFLTDQFNVICGNDGGSFVDGWCVDKKNKDRALFWAKIKTTGKDFNGVIRPAIDFVVITPPLNKTADDPVWINYIGSLGFLPASERKLQTEQMLKKESIGALVCRKVTTGVHPTQRFLDKGYIEDSANGRIKVRIFEKPNRRGSFDPTAISSRADSYNETVWDRPSHWFMCD